jgi:hypothetical protein
MQCWKRMEMISWTDHVRNEDILHTLNEERNILHTIKRKKDNWIDHVLCRNCILKHATEGHLQGTIEMTWRQGRRRKQLLDNFKENRIYRKLKEQALDCSQRRTCFGRGKEPVGRQTTESINECVVGYWFHAWKLCIFCFCNILYYGICIICTCLIICRINMIQVQLSLKDNCNKQINTWNIHDFF